MRVLHVLDSLVPAGSAAVHLRLLANLPPGDVHDIVALEGGSLEGAFRAIAGDVVTGPDTARLDQLLASAYDVACVTSSATAERVVPRAVTTTRTRLVYCKGYDVSARLRLTDGHERAEEDALLAACDHVVFTTGQLAEEYPVTAGARTTILGPAADVRPLLAIPPPAATAPARILALTGATSRRRLGDLVAALELVRQRVPDATVRVVGPSDPVESGRVERLAARAGLGGAFTLGGMVPDIAPELAAARVVALPSSSQGAPLPILEALAAGRPVVATTAGHGAAVMDDGVEGFLVPVGDVPLMAARLTALLTNHPLAATMGSAGRRRAAGHSVEAIARRLAEILATAGGVR
ncbi:MAG: glycosyltransferase family 4 protein [Vicinamibacterales bacterium]